MRSVCLLPPQRRRHPASSVDVAVAVAVAVMRAVERYGTLVTVLIRALAQSYLPAEYRNQLGEYVKCIRHGITSRRWAPWQRWERDGNSRLSKANICVNLHREGESKGWAWNMEYNPQRRHSQLGKQNKWNIRRNYA